MHHPSTIVHWADIDNTEAVKDSLSALFQRFCVKAINDNNPPEKNIIRISEINFTDKNVKLKDWFGWTQLHKVIKVETRSKVIWDLVKVANREILLAPKTKILVYKDPSEYTVGFHGETKYHSEIKNRKDLMPGEYIRIRNGISPEGEEIEFSKDISVIDTKLGNCYYVIITRSGRFNANDIYMHSDIIPIYSQLS